MASGVTRTEVATSTEQGDAFARALSALAGRKEPITSFVVILASWQAVSFFVPPYLVPGIPAIVAT